MARTVIIVGVLDIEYDEDGITDPTDKTGLTGDAHLALTTGQFMPDGKPFPFHIFQWDSALSAVDVDADDVVSEWRA